MNRPQTARSRASGFSLTEMLVVIGIIAVISAVGLPNLIGYFRASKIRSAQDQVAGAIQKARNTGIMKNTQMGVDFIIQNNTTYWIHIEDSIGGVAGAQSDVGFARQAINFATPNTAISSQYLLPANVEFAAAATDCPTVGYTAYAPNAAAVRFDRYGTPTVPGMGNPTAPALSGSPATTNRIYVPANGDLMLCLIDRRTNLRRGLRLSTSGRILRDQTY